MKKIAIIVSSLFIAIVFFGTSKDVLACDKVSNLSVVKDGTQYTAKANVVNCAPGSTLRFTVYKDGAVAFEIPKDGIIISNGTGIAEVTQPLTVPGNYSFELKKLYPSPSVVLGLKQGIVVNSESASSQPPSTSQAPQRDTDSGTGNTPPVTPPTRNQNTSPNAPTPNSGDPCGRLSSDISQFGDGQNISSIVSGRCYTTGGLISKIASWLIGLSGAISILIFMYGGYRYMVSAGNAESATAGKKIMQWALIGLVVVILAYTIVSVVTRFILSGDVL